MADATDTVTEDQPLVHGTDEAQEQVTAEDEKGYRGIRVNPIAESEYSIQSGPKSPTVIDEQVAMAKEATPNV